MAHNPTPLQRSLRRHRLTEHDLHDAARTAMGRTILGTVLAATLIAGGTGVASAAPPEQEVIPLVCDNGESFDIVVNGHGHWTPGRVVGSTNVLVPTGFSDFGYRAVTPEGDVYEDTFPGEDSKGGGNVAQRNPRPTVTCTLHRDVHPA